METIESEFDHELWTITLKLDRFFDLLLLSFLIRL